ncbi:F0F1 ATP synthase subunit alpha [Candidatus Gromoviella agglomerans]|uniref:F0F1 ATP synthase subunit alpha n=1 Tax=Candidatus Gromoviella agglomerans TaxID=2806609 RepID=UPI001E28566E|nr:F0F1 ATP synthase subunit alpha [Candidatus Gromoviella agglomerans]UFX98202.1 ATP synthase subunit alpha [Candidatus Gromoviella agglomerans]
MNFSEIAAKIHSYSSFTQGACDIQEIGRVIGIADGIAKVFGLFNAFMNEVVVFDSGVKGIVMSLEPDLVYVAVIGDFSSIAENDVVKRTCNLPCGPYGKGVLGRIFNAFGSPIDMSGDCQNVEMRKVEIDAPGIMMRKAVSEPMYTGVLAIDSCLAIGMGQRELIIGDRQSGKTTLAINMILNQANNTLKKVYCIYVSIGQRLSEIASIAKKFRDLGVMDYSVIVAASASDTAIEQFMAPYLACTIAEYFRDNGMHALIVYDDLSKHAVAYREISLLLQRPPGREAYPGDVFYIHSRLLERAGKMSDNMRGGSMTAIPIIETKMGDVSGYIATNVISITDGQIFLDKKKFNSGIMPPINLPLSVSRIGANAQERIIKKLSAGVKFIIAQYEELKEFTKFSTSKDADTQRVLDNGAILEKILQQDKPMNFIKTVIILFAFKNGHFFTLTERLREKSSTPSKILSIDNIDYMSFIDYILSKDDDIFEKIHSREFEKTDEEILSIIIQNAIEEWVSNS